MSSEKVQKESISILQEWIRDVTGVVTGTSTNGPNTAQLIYFKGQTCALIINIDFTNEDIIKIKFLDSVNGGQKDFQFEVNSDRSNEELPSDFKDRFIKEISQLKEFIIKTLKVPNISTEHQRSNDYQRSRPGDSDDGGREPKIPTVSNNEPPLHRGNRPPDMPDFDDEYEILRREPLSARPSYDAFPSIGDDDLNPPGLPKHPEMKPYLDHRPGYGDGGMHPSGNHPLFSGRFGRGSPSGPPGVPPGARYDDPTTGDGFEGIGGPGFQGNFGPPGYGSGSGSGSGFGFGPGSGSGSGSGPFGF
ncbi:hypothetical protein CAAN1_01S03972 [[Candida] anglica]|uniref:PI31 proteasome regulator C-terminal domain-containing protein n=1 Tax=[Candida] anglica TaxID=148631 RepID=A0ABP0EJG2_9ASCO